jgi:predicted dehydrogenase
MEIKTNRKMKIAIIGAGLIGESRIKAVKQLENEGRAVNVSAVYDPAKLNDEKLRSKYDINLVNSIDDLYQTEPNWVFIALPHDIAVDATIDALKRGKKVLVEKPMGRNMVEANKLLSNATNDQLFVGFNYRFFDGISKALSDFKEKKFGNVISINVVLGHGSDPNITKTWKLDPDKAGGGCLIDPGIHLLDLIRIFAGDEIEILGGSYWDGFWKTGIEEEAHLLLKSKEGILFNMQVSIVKWCSTFRLEINGSDKYGIVEGRGRSYGLQTYTIGERWGWLKGRNQKDSEERIIESDGDNVFYKETRSLLFGDENNITHVCTAEEALKNMRLLEESRKILRI